MVNSIKQISQLTGGKKSAKQIAWHHAAQLINKLNCSLGGGQWKFWDPQKQRL